MSKKLIIFFLVLCSVSALKAQKVPVQKAPAEKATVQKTTVQKTTVQKTAAQKTTAQKTTAQKAQVQYSDGPPALGDIPLFDNNWALIGKKEYKKISEDKYAVVFPAALQAMNNKIYELRGYMVPMKAGMKHDTFMLAVLPLAQCEFCGMGGIPDMVEIHMTKAIYYTDDPITISGKLVLKSEVYESNLASTSAVVYESNILLVDAESHN